MDKLDKLTQKLTIKDINVGSKEDEAQRLALILHKSKSKIAEDENTVATELHTVKHNKDTYTVRLHGYPEILNAGEKIINAKEYDKYLFGEKNIEDITISNMAYISISKHKGNSINNSEMIDVRYSIQDAINSIEFLIKNN